MILLWGMAPDPPLKAVQRALALIGAPYVLLDQRSILSTDVELHIGVDVLGRVRCGELELNLADVRACYLRPDDSRQLVDVAAAGVGSAAWLHALNVEDTLLSWSEITPAFVVNRVSAMGSNTSKPYQLELLRACGFETPETIVTTDPSAVAAFWATHEHVIYKSVSGVRSKVSRLTDHDRGRLADVVACPTQFQEYLPGTDYRVHVVGDATFACAVTSDSDDYRYGSNVVTPCTLPDDLCSRCVALAESLGLVVAGVDLRRTPDGRWYCFEVNPSPGFTFYDRLEGEPIAMSIAALLSGDRIRNIACGYSCVA